MKLRSADTTCKDLLFCTIPNFSAIPNFISIFLYYATLLAEIINGPMFTFGFLSESESVCARSGSALSGVLENMPINHIFKNNISVCRFGETVAQHSVNVIFGFYQCNRENLRNRKQQKMLNNRYLIGVCVCVCIFCFALLITIIGILYGKICLCA